MFVQVVCGYSDYYDKYGQQVNGEKVYTCETMEELYQILKSINEENKLSHVHLDFCKQGKSCVESFGGIVAIFKEGVTPFTTL